jgi:hypothetical protein
MHRFPHRLPRHYLAQLEQHLEEPPMPGMWFRLHRTSTLRRKRPLLNLAVPSQMDFQGDAHAEHHH